MKRCCRQRGSEDGAAGGKTEESRRFLTYNEEEEEEEEDTLAAGKRDAGKDAPVKNEIGFIRWVTMPQQNALILFMEVDSWADQ